MSGCVDREDALGKSPGGGELPANCYRPIRGGRVIFVETMAYLQWIRLGTGKRLWKKTDVKDEPRLYRFRGIGAIPYKPGQALLVGTDGVFILNPQTGDVIKYIKSRGNKQIGGAPMLFGDKVIYGTVTKGCCAMT